VSCFRRSSPPRLQPRRFHGSIEVSPIRLIGEVDKVANELLQHLTKLPGAKVTVSIDIEATVPDEVPDDVVRTVAENARTLKFTNAEFEQD
jgi:hypothetical protein